MNYFYSNIKIKVIQSTLCTTHSACAQSTTTSCVSPSLVCLEYNHLRPPATAELVRCHHSLMSRHLGSTQPTDLEASVESTGTGEPVTDATDNTAGVTPLIFIPSLPYSHSTTFNCLYVTYGCQVMSGVLHGQICLPSMLY